MTEQCSAAGCLRPATDEGWRDGELLWRGCEEHAAAMRPTVQLLDRELSVAARMLVEGARAAVSYGRSLGSTDDEIALAVLDALFGRAAMRGLAHQYVEERDAAAQEERG